MIRKFEIFKTFYFLLALVVLLLNDFLFKDLFGNWLTGKLSDFTGLFVFALFWITLFPNRKKLVLVTIGLLFIFWKSAFSDNVIFQWNSLKIINIHRIQDYSDLLALSVLPFAYFIDLQKEKLPKLQISPMIPLFVSCFAFVATSYQNKENLNKVYVLNLSKDTVMARMNRNDSLNYGRDIIFEDKNPDTLTFSIPSSLCSSYFDATISINGVSDTITIINAIQVTHRCKKNENDKPHFIKDFEKHCIQPIRFPQIDSLKNKRSK